MRSAISFSCAAFSSGVSSLTGSFSCVVSTSVLILVTFCWSVTSCRDVFKMLRVFWSLLARASWYSLRRSSMFVIFTVLDLKLKRDFFSSLFKMLILFSTSARYCLYFLRSSLYAPG